MTDRGGPVGGEDRQPTDPLGQPPVPESEGVPPVPPPPDEVPPPGEEPWGQEQMTPPPVVVSGDGTQPPEDGGRNVTNWLLGGVLVALLIIIGVLLFGGGDGDDEAAESTSTTVEETTTTVEGTTTTVEETTTTVEETTTTVEETTTTTEAETTTTTEAETTTTTVVTAGSAEDAFTGWIDAIAAGDSATAFGLMAPESQDAAGGADGFEALLPELQEGFGAWADAENSEVFTVEIGEMDDQLVVTIIGDVVQEGEELTSAVSLPVTRGDDGPYLVMPFLRGAPVEFVAPEQADPPAVFPADGIFEVLVPVTATTWFAVDDVDDEAVIGDPSPEGDLARVVGLLEDPLEPGVHVVTVFYTDQDVFHTDSVVFVTE